MTRKNLANIRTMWMATLADIVNTDMPRLSGRIDWGTASFMFNTGRTPSEAAARLIELEQEREQAMVAAFVSEGLGE